MARPKGIPHTEEWRKANSERMKKHWADKKNREAQSRKLRESWSDPELRKRQSETMKRRYEANPEKWAVSEETRKKISKSLTGKPSPHTPEQNAKIAKALKGKKKSAETCKKISEVKKGQTYRPRSEEHTRNQSKAQTDRPKSNVHKENLSKAGKKYFDSPAGREQTKKHSRDMKQWHKDHPEESAAMIDAAQATNPKWHDTKPELQMAEILDGLGLRYEKQHRALWMPKGHRGHRWDFRLLDVNVLIEVDGCYFHGCPEHSSVDRRVELAESARKELDRDVEAELSGWTVLRFWEHELNDVPDDVTRCVMNAVERCRAVPAVA